MTTPHPNLPPIPTAPPNLLPYLLMELLQPPLLLKSKLQTLMDLPNLSLTLTVLPNLPPKSKPAIPMDPPNPQQIPMTLPKPNPHLFQTPTMLLPAPKALLPLSIPIPSMLSQLPVITLPNLKVTKWAKFYLPLVQPSVQTFEV